MAPQTAPTAAVRRTLRVGVPIDFAFRMLTEKMGTWWPASHHIGKVPFAEVIVEPRVGGKWMERGGGGEECQWGTVLAWDPPKQVVFSWQLQADWTFSTDMSRASEVAFTFFAEGPEMTRLEFEHRHFAGRPRKMPSTSPSSRTVSCGGLPKSLCSSRLTPKNAKRFRTAT